MTKSKKPAALSLMNVIHGADKQANVRFRNSLAKPPAKPRGSYTRKGK